MSKVDSRRLKTARRALTRAENTAKGEEPEPRIVTAQFARYIEMRRFMRVACGECYEDEIERWRTMLISASKFQTRGDLLGAAEWLTAQFEEHGGDDLTTVAIGAALVDLLERRRSAR